MDCLNHIGRPSHRKKRINKKLQNIWDSTILQMLYTIKIRWSLFNPNYTLYVWFYIRKNISLFYKHDIIDRALISWSDWRTMRVPFEYETKQNEAERNEKIFRCCFVWFRFISTGNETKPNETNRIFGFVSIGFVLFWFVSFRSVSFRTLHVPYYEYIKMLAVM